LGRMPSSSAFWKILQFGSFVLRNTFGCITW
jgi:hypothetical protein